ncbi:MAG: hypothetical protein PHU25_01940 [Deltaproteobacteria bacterium]|nr:hypothetical protein [Deltaproteobacteria bacterium]
MWFPFLGPSAQLVVYDRLFEYTAVRGHPSNRVVAGSPFSKLYTKAEAADWQAAAASMSRKHNAGLAPVLATLVTAPVLRFALPPFDELATLWVQSPVVPRVVESNIA